MSFLPLALALAALWSPQAAPAASLCVGGPPGCFSTVQAAVNAAADGDTITVAPGTYAGGITIEKSLELLGAGARRTVIRGGGPVLMIGAFGASNQPTVGIDGLTITGGVAHSSPESQAFVGADDVIALGGGIKINPSADFSTGATVTVRNSVVTGNRAAPTATLPFGPPCPGGPCAFAWAKGGGIDNWGRLTLRNSAVSENEAAGVTSDADGGGINNWEPATLTLVDSDVVGNRAVVRVPNGRFAEGGGIFTDPDVPLSISGGSVSDNTASLTSRLPFDVGGGETLDMNANGGGIHAGDDGSVTIERGRMRGNRVEVNDPNGEPAAFDAALHPGSGPLVVRDSVIADGELFAIVGSSAAVGPSGSALDINGPATITSAQITRNTTVVRSQSGVAAAAGTVYAGDASSQSALIAGSTISHNTTTASSVSGPATVQGAGILRWPAHRPGRPRRAQPRDRDRPGGFAQGGGIWNGSQFNSPPIELTLRNTAATHNRLRVSGGLAVQGGGLFTAFPVTLAGGVIAHNAPDDCFGCPPGPLVAASPPVPRSSR